MRADVMEIWVRRPLRLLLFLGAACVGVAAILLAVTAIPEAGRNPGSPEFGSLRNGWLVGFLVANAVVLPTIRIASGQVRMLFAALLMIIWGASIVSAYQYCLYQLR